VLTSHAVRAICSVVAVLDLVGRNECSLEGRGHGGGQSHAGSGCWLSHGDRLFRLFSGNPKTTAAFVAATIAKTDPMDAGWTAMRFGWASYIVPFLFVYSPALIMRGNALEIGLVMLLSIAGIWFVCAAFTGYALRVMPLLIRVALGVAGLSS
jgi:hypothetical protein